MALFAENPQQDPVVCLFFKNIRKVFVGLQKINGNYKK
jgi:hypothetical protein